MALGQEFAGVMGTSGELIEVLEQAGGETGERVWPLPLIDAHREQLKSKVADIKNLGPREGGALTAAAFLSYFVPEDIAWALEHLGPQAAAPVRDPVRLTAERYGRVPRAYIVCERDPGFPPAVQRGFIERSPCEAVVSMQTSHSPFANAPEELAAHLIALGERFAA